MSVPTDRPRELPISILIMFPLTPYLMYLWKHFASRKKCSREWNICWNSNCRLWCHAPFYFYWYSLLCYQFDSFSKHFSSSPILVKLCCMNGFHNFLMSSRVFWKEATKGRNYMTMSIKWNIQHHSNNLKV